MKLLRTRCPAAILGLAAAVSLAGCFGKKSDVRCEPTDRYTTVGSVGPVRIPDDLTPPDESDALQLPTTGADDGSSVPPGGCLEDPPKFSRDEGAQTPPAAAPPPTVPAPSPDREITN